MYDVTFSRNIPMAMAGFKQWLCYQLVDRGGERMGKPPVSPKTGEVCSKNDESNFTDLEEALIGCETYDLDGVGFVFLNGFLAIDLDDCFDDDGVLTDVAQDIFDHFKGTYVEYSPSGNGLHIFVRGEKPNNRTKDSSIGVEVYNGYNFVTVTGDHIDGTANDVVELQEEIDWLFDTYLPDTTVIQHKDIIVDHGERTPDEWFQLGMSRDNKLAEAYNNVDHSGDESSLDMSLLMKLAYWLNRDEAAVTKMFLESPWVKSKDKEHADKLARRDYLPDSVRKAVTRVNDTASNCDRQFKVRAASFLALHTDANGRQKVELESYTDRGNAQVMASVYSDILCYTKAWGWMYYNGVSWEMDADWRAMECAITIGDSLLNSADEWIAAKCEELERLGIDSGGSDARKVLSEALELKKHAVYTLSSRGLTAMLTIAKMLMMENPNSFDANPWLLNTPEFIVDLSTGERYPHSAHHKCVNCTSVAPSLDPTQGVPPMFEKFLNQIFCGDADLISYVQMLTGAALVGKVYNENLIIANGSGSNGKSTLFGVLQSLLGSYATAINPELLMSSNVNEQQMGMAMLQGKRLAIAQETEAGQQMRTSMLKRLVSTDDMVAKKLYHDPMTFTPTHTLVLATNHLPVINANDKGTWRRIIVLPFNATIEAKDMIADFQNVLIRNEGPNILDWCIDGAVKFFEMNCVISDAPASVKKATENYRSSEDWFNQFVSECCVDGGYVYHKELYSVYRRWCVQNGEHGLTNNGFSRMLNAAGWKADPKRYDKRTKKAAKAWVGHSLKAGVDESFSLKVVS